MVMLTIDSLKNALNYIQENGKIIRYYDAGPKKGLIITDGMNENEAYHIRVLELSELKTITRLSESYTVLSLIGQELLDIISDGPYLNFLITYLNRQGYTRPSDRQIFRLACERMINDNSKSWAGIMRDIIADFSDRQSVLLPGELEDFHETDMINGDSEKTETLAVEETELLNEIPLAEKIIKDSKKKITS